MFNQYPFSKDYQKQKTTKVIKLYDWWLAYDIWTLGLTVYTWLNIHLLSTVTVLEAIEKFILFCCSLTFIGYRIYIMHLDAKKKEIENDMMRDELKTRRKAS